MTGDGTAPAIEPRDQFLLEEYKNAAQLTYHVDGLRDRLSAFYVTVTGLAAAGLSLVLKDDADALAVDLVTLLFLLVGLLGFVMTMIVARLRAVQIEHFRILSNIRQHYIGVDLALWNTVELAPTRVPKPNRSSGSYMWFAAIMLVAAFAAAVGTYFLVHEANAWLRNSYSIALAALIAASWGVVLDRVYLRRAQAKPPPRYTSPPTVDLDTGDPANPATPTASAPPTSGTPSDSRRTTLIGIAVAGAISVTVAEGEWNPLTIPLGAALLLVLAAYDDGTRLGWRERLAFAAAYGLALMVTVAGIGAPDLGEWTEFAYWAAGTVTALLVGSYIERRNRNA